LRYVEREMPSEPAGHELELTHVELMSHAVELVVFEVVRVV
jgi:hypothetical protein